MDYNSNDIKPPHGWQVLQSRLQSKLDRIESKGRTRSLRKGHQEGVIDLSHNDYLGIRSDPSFHKSIHNQVADLPFGSGGSRLLGGEHPIFQDLEDSFSKFKGSSSSTFFTSGYAANQAICRALIGPRTSVHFDKLNHASLIDGLKLAPIKQEQVHYFPHNSLKDLEQSLESSNAELRLVFTESIFSMDGDRGKLKEIFQFCQQYDGFLIIDEAHALGVHGSRGQGLLEENQIDPDHVVTVNPCGKGMGASGAFISGPGLLKNYLINSSRELIFSTAPSPWMASGLKHAIKDISTRYEERLHLAEISELVRKSLKDLGYDTGFCNSHIIPVIFGSESTAVKAELYLQERGIICRAIRPPSVHPKASRLRISLNSSITNTQCCEILSAFKDLKNVI